MRNRLKVLPWALAIILTLISIQTFRAGRESRVNGAGDAAQGTGRKTPGEPPVETPDAGSNHDVATGSTPDPVSQGIAPAAAMVAAEQVGPGGDAADSPHLTVQRTLSEHWLDPEGKAARRRVRVVETGFKYPLVRVEDEVVRLPDGTESVVFGQVQVADHLMIGLKDGDRQVADRVKKAGWNIRGEAGGAFLLVEIADAADPEALPAALAELHREFPDAAYIEPDPILWALDSPNDPRFASGSLWGLHNSGGRSGYAADADIDAPEGWETIHDAPGTVVAVIDTGIRHTHEDLAANMWTNLAEVPGNGLDDDGNGVIDDIHGFDAANDDGDPMDDQGHGTHCAGTIGAVGNNGKGISGVAWKVQLMAVKFLTASGGGTTSDAILAVDYARLNGAKVINASWGGGPYHAGLFEAIRNCSNAGIPFVAAAGNDGANNDSVPHYPSSYNLPNIVAVAATGPDDRLASFSCYGKTSVDIAAPGVDIFSTYHTSDQAYKSLNGTSMATPHVCGMLALARAKYPLEKDKELLKRLADGADSVPALKNLAGKGLRANLRGLLGAAPSSGVAGNDHLVNAERIDGSYTAWSGSNAGATREPGESSFNPAKGARSVWLAWSAPASGIADLTLDADPAGQGLRVVVFKVTGANDLTVVADSFSAAAQSGSARLRFGVSGGSDHRIAITSDTQAGQFLALALTLRPPNDNLADAAELAGERFATSGTTMGATAEPFETLRPHAGVGAGKSIWWKWTASFTGPFVLTTEGSEFDTVLAVYKPGSGENPTVEVASNDDASPLDGSSALEFNAVAGTTYLMAVDSYRSDSQGACKLNGFRQGAVQILSQPADVEVALGGRATFNVSAGGALKLGYQWFKDGVALPGQTGRTLVIDPVLNQDLGGYSVEVSDSRDLITSRTAQLREKLSAPKITWTSGNQAVEVNGTINLRVQASGSLPMSFKWAKDGAVLAGQAEPFLTLGNAGATDSGVYVCTATNGSGSVSASMVVSVVQSPFDAFTWAREAVPNSPITDLKSIDGKCYAVAGERILVSSDAREWTPWMLPSGFDGATLAKLGTSWYCSGFRIDGKHAMAISTDGVTWQAPVAVTGLDPIMASRGVAMLQLETQGGRLIGSSSDVPPGSGSSGIDYSSIYHSTNGIAWTKAQWRKPDNTLAPISATTRFMSWGGKLYLPFGRTVSSQTNATVLTSTDGLIWEETVLPPNPDGRSTGTGAAIIPCGGQLYLISGTGIFSSPDGATWTFLGFRSNSNAKYLRGAEASDGCYGFWSMNLDVSFGSSPAAWFNAGLGSWTSIQIQPAAGQSFTCATSFQGAAVFGTSGGCLRRVDRREDVTLPSGTTFELSTISFLNDEFIAYRPMAAQQSPGPLLLSGDGQTWRPGRSFTTTSTDSNFPVRACIAGKYFSAPYLGTVPPSGWVPSALTTTNPPPAGVTGGIASAAFDGTRWLVLASSGCYSVTADGSTWTKLAITGYSPSQNDSILRFNNKWYATSPNDFSTRLRQSSDGISWAPVAGVSPAHVVVFGGKLCGVTADGYSCVQSADGVSWQSFTIAPGIGTTGIGSTSVAAVRLGVFNNSLVMLARDTFGKRGFLYFSSDGQTWARTSVTTRICDFAVGKGVLAAVTTNGGVVLARSSAAAGAAPITRITAPLHRSVHLTGSTVEIAGTATDPEGQQVTSECFVDGVSLGTVTGQTFRFSYPLTSNTGHVVTVRSRDPQGLVGSDEVAVSVTAPQLANLLESGEGKSFVPVTSWTSFGGFAYAAGPTSLYRSRGDGTWEQVILPILPSAITNIVSGNGTLILQTSGAAFFTRDGVNWWQVSDFGNGVSIGISPIVFKDGWFINASVPMYSRDGLSWNVGLTIPSSTSLTAPIVTPGGALLGSPPFRSVDGGVNWLSIPQFSGVGYSQIQFASCFGATFAGLSDGRVFRSADDGATWSPVAQFPALPAGHHARLSVHAGRLYWGGGGVWLASSVDGVTWQAFTGAVVASSVIEQIDGRFVGFGRAGMVFSADGVTWEAAPTAPACAAPGMLAEDGNQLLMGDVDGGLWQTRNGVNWTRVMPGKPSALPPTYLDSNGMVTIRIGSQTVISGTSSSGGIYFSGNAGLEWKRATYHGGSIANVAIQKLWTDGVTAFAHVTRSGNLEGRDFNELWRSDDGIDWTRVWAWSSGAVADMCGHDGTWLCVGTNGSLRYSSDAGFTWSTASVPGLLSARLVRHFDGVWMLIGAEAVNLQGPNVVFSSPDSENWTRLGSLPGETAWSKVASVSSETAIVVVTSSGKVYTAGDRNLAWTQTATTSSITTPVVERIGTKFCISDRLVSDDGITWKVPTALSGGGTPTAEVYFAGVYLTFMINRNPQWSSDGLNWTEMTGSPTTLRGNSVFAYDATTLHARDSTGAAFATTDGKSWTLAAEGQADTSGQAYARKIISFGPRLIAGGTSGLLMVSEDDGKSWQNCLLNGRPFPSSLSAGSLETGGSQVMVKMSSRYFRSSDGLTWSEITSAVGDGVADFKWSGGRWLAIRSDGSLIQSTDDGTTWTPAGAVPGVTVGRQITHYKDLWIVACSVGSDSTPYSLFTSPDAVTWTNRGSTSSPQSTHSFFTGHGLLYFGTGPESVQSSDGITWTGMGKGGNTGAPDASGYTAKWMVPVADGYVAFNTSSTKTYFWSAPRDGGDWAWVPSYQNQVSAIASLDSSRLFLCGPGSIKEWTRADFALAVGEPAPADLGVGDTLAVTVTVRNQGNEAMPPGDPLAVDAWLSSDGFFGDGNDTYVGRVSLPVEAPAPGAQISCALEFTLPGTIVPGTHHVVLRLDTQGRLDESNRSNNTILTRGAVINIPQWQLNLATFGAGEVMQTSARRFYPHKASIGLFARAGKGAAFGGWGGDAVGGLSETSVLMDGDKNVTATFVAQASLRVVTIGNGTLNVPASGAMPVGSGLLLTATPAAGWEFERWEGAVSGTSSSIPLTLDGDKVVRAYFRQSLTGWKSLHFNAAELAQPAISGDDADPDKDGVANWQEFVHGSNPRDPGSTGRGVIRQDGNELVVIYTRNQNPAGGLAVACQASRALNAWGTTDLIQQVLGQSDGVETLEARLPMAGHSRGFMRFFYTRPEP